MSRNNHDRAPDFAYAPQSGPTTSADPSPNRPGRSQRVLPRFPCAQPLVVQVMPQRRPGFAGGRCRDLSTGGMKLVTDMTLQPGQSVRVKLKAPPRMLEFEGRVVWATGNDRCEDAPGPTMEKHTAGVEFSYIDPDDHEFLTNFLFDLASDASPANDGGYDVL